MEKRNIIIKNYNILKNVGLLLFFFFFLFSFSNKTYASTPIQFYPTITNDTFGYASTTCISTGHIYNFQTYRGIFPDTSNLISDSGFGDSVCTVLFAGAYWVEGGFEDNTKSTPDDNYWFRYTTVGVAYTSADYTGTYYYFNAKRINSIWFIGDDPFLTTTTRIITEDLPVANSTTATNNVTFQFHFYARGDDGYDRVGRELRDVTSNIQFLTKETDILASAISTYSTTTPLTQAHFYLWRAYLKNSSTGNLIFGQWSSFNVVSSSASSTDIVFLGDTATSTGFLSFLNVPNLLATKVPFAYIFQFATLLQNLDSNSATNIPSGTFDVDFASGTPAHTILHVDMFSTTTITYFLTPTYLGILRGFMVVVTYFSTVWFLYHDAKRRHIV